MTFVANDFAMRVSLEKNRDFSLHFVDLQREKFANALRIVFKKKNAQLGFFRAVLGLCARKNGISNLAYFFHFSIFYELFFCKKFDFFEASRQHDDKVFEIFYTKNRVF